MNNIFLTLLVFLIVLLLFFILLPLFLKWLIIDRKRNESGTDDVVFVIDWGALNKNAGEYSPAEVRQAGQNLSHLSR